MRIWNEFYIITMLYLLAVDIGVITPLSSKIVSGATGAPR